MKISINPQTISTKDSLNASTPAHQDFNFELWAMAVREQMMSVLAHKGSALERTSQSTLSKLVN